jgi:hypothetical protein
MSTKSCFGAAALAACFALTAANANTKVLTRSGSWEAFGGTTVKGHPVCGISSEQQGGYFGLKFFSGDDVVTIQMGKNTWKIKNGAKQALTIRFDANKPWHATGTGFHFNDGDAGLEFTVRKVETVEFMREISASRLMHIHFNGSNANDWSMNLNGVSAARSAYETCDRNLK